MSARNLACAVLAAAFSIFVPAAARADNALEGERIARLQADGHGAAALAEARVLQARATSGGVAADELLARILLAHGRSQEALRYARAALGAAGAQAANPTSRVRAETDVALALLEGGDDGAAARRIEVAVRDERRSLGVDDGGRAAAANAEAEIAWNRGEPARGRTALARARRFDRAPSDALQSRFLAAELLDDTDAEQEAAELSALARDAAATPAAFELRCTILARRLYVDASLAGAGTIPSEDSRLRRNVDVLLAHLEPRAGLCATRLLHARADASFALDQYRATTDFMLRARNARSAEAGPTEVAVADDDFFLARAAAYARDERLAERALRQGIALYRASSLPPARRDAAIWAARGRLAADRGDYEKALRLHARALASLDRAEGQTFAPAVQQLLAVSRAALDLGRIREADIALERATRLAYRSYGLGDTLADVLQQQIVVYREENRPAALTSDHFTLLGIAKRRYGVADARILATLDPFVGDESASNDGLLPYLLLWDLGVRLQQDRSGAIELAGGTVEALRRAARGPPAFQHVPLFAYRPTKADPVPMVIVRRPELVRTDLLVMLGTAASVEASYDPKGAAALSSLVAGRIAVLSAGKPLVVVRAYFDAIETSNAAQEYDLSAQQIRAFLAFTAALHTGNPEIVAAARAYAELTAATFHFQHQMYVDADAELARADADYARIPLLRSERLQLPIFRANVAKRLGHVDDAWRFFTQGIAAQNERIADEFATTSESERVATLDDFSKAYQAQLYLFEQHKDEHPEWIETLYDETLDRKDLVARSAVSLQRSIVSLRDRVTFERLQKLRARRTAVIAAAAAKVRAGGDENDISRLDQQLRVIEGQIDVEAQRIPGLADRRTPTWRDVQRRLAPNEAAVEVIRAGRLEAMIPSATAGADYVAFTLRPGDSRPSLVVLGDAATIEGEAMAAYRQQTRNDGTDRHVYTRTLGTTVWAPIASQLGPGTTRVYLAPDGVLDTVAFDPIALPGGKLLVDSYDLRVLTTTGELVRSADAASRPQTNLAIVLGNPSYALGEAQQSAALAALRAGSPVRTLAALDPAPGDAAPTRAATSRGAPLAPLPQTQAEADNVSGQLRAHGLNVAEYTGDAAQRAVVADAVRPRILHLATHGFFARGTQQGDVMLESGLLFAGADRYWASGQVSRHTDDGVLSALEATGLDLTGTELVVLSACSSGLGEVDSGEGVFGLRRAFREAGASAVLMSMWDVPDMQTAFLMQKFYAHWLGGEEKHAALRAAEAELRAEVIQDYGFDVPWLWGGFVLIGN